MHLFDRIERLEDELKRKHWPTGFRTWCGWEAMWWLIAENLLGLPYMSGPLVDAIRFYLWLIGAS